MRAFESSLTGINSDIRILALLPESQAYLKKRGIPYLNSAQFFDRKSHEDILLKSNEMLSEIRRLLFIEDDAGIKEGYNNSFVFFLRLFILYILWLIETIDKVVAALNVKSISSAYCAPAYALPFDREGYVGLLCERFSQKDIRYERLGTPVNAVKESAVGDGLFKKLLRNILSKYIYLRLLAYKAQGKKIILATSKLYNLEKVINGFRDSYGEGAFPVYLSGKFQDIGKALFFNGEIPNVVFSEPFIKTWNIEFQEKLNLTCRKINGLFDKNRKLTTYRGIDFGDMLLSIIEKGITPYLGKIYDQSAQLDKFIAHARPDLVISQMSRNINYNLGELAGKYGIPAVLISHGSHVPPANIYEEIEWGENSLGLINTHYEYICVQTPWAKKFLNILPAKSQSIVTGPLLFARTALKDKQALRKKIIPRVSNKFIILHASSPRTKSSMRLYVYETVDEYIHNINSLIRAVDKLENMHLIVRFKPGIDVSIDDFRELLVASDSYSVHSEGAFYDYLAIADLLVSYSSTAIEEALQNKVPVLLYDPQGKYCHIKDAQLLAPGLKPVLDSCYFVDKEENLPWALRWVADKHLAEDLPASLWERHIFREDEKTSLHKFFENIFKK